MPQVNFKDELILYIKARFTLIHVVTFEEERVLRDIADACIQAKKYGYTWDSADGFAILTPDAPLIERPSELPITALEQVEKYDQAAVFVLKDFHALWDSEINQNTGAEVLRKLKNIALVLKQSKKNIIVISHKASIPDELRDSVYVVDYPAPDENVIRAILDEYTNVQVQLNALGKDQLVRSALGLTASQTRRVFAKAIVRKGSLDEEDIDLVTKEKKAIISESGALEFISAAESGKTLEKVGGLDVLKEWLKSRENCFSKEAQDYGLKPPKGLLLVGIPGTGKSLTAKVVSGLWKQPLIRLDMGAVFGSLVGQSENNIRRALKLAETVSPCVLWVDEVEKGISQGDGDSGTSSRVFGTLLTWLEEKEKPVFVICTANNISRIPPEFSRAGRFDAIFFLDLPTQKERREIFKVHLLNVRPPECLGIFDLDRLAMESEGYVGAEIEQVVKAAMVKAFNVQREFTTDDIVDVLRTKEEVVPLISAQRENIERLRRWLKEGRARSASFAEIETALDQQVKVPPEYGEAPVLEI